MVIIRESSDTRMEALSNLFSGQFYDFTMSTEPLLGSSFYAKGSSTMLFQKDGRLYRLTREGCGHALLAKESQAGNPNFTRVIHDFGPVAPSDEGKGEFYWLAEVEWLEKLDKHSAQTESLVALLSRVTDDEELVMGDDLTDLITACKEAGTQTGFGDLLQALIISAEFAINHDAGADIKLSNVMKRPGTGEYVLIDPIAGNHFDLSGAQELAMAEFR